jgi:hypothetical protein
MLLLLPPPASSDNFLPARHTPPLQDAIGKAVASAGQKTIVATKKGIDYAQLANRGGVQPFMFDTGAKH